jgi:hypothetical protein
MFQSRSQVVKDMQSLFRQLRRTLISTSVKILHEIEHSRGHSHCLLQVPPSPGECHVNFELCPPCPSGHLLYPSPEQEVQADEVSRMNQDLHCQFL